MEKSLSSERVRELLSYDPDTGVFRWLVDRGRTRAGSVAGKILRPEGYRYIGIERRHYRAHRLAWLYVTGEWPVHHIDHRNGIRDDNRIANLREATSAENSQNVRRAPRNKKSCGLLGVTWHKKVRKFQAQIKLDGKTHYLGVFSTADEGYAAYLAAKSRLHPFSTIS